MKGQQAVPPINEEVYLRINKDRWEQTTFMKLSDNMKGLIMQSPEYGMMVNGSGHAPEEPMADASMNDDIPF